MNMTVFSQAFSKTMRYEGSFVNDPDDPGGMTYMGISRRNFPAWSGWGLIDALLRATPHPIFSHNDELQDMVRVFYAVEFWQRLQLDLVADMSWPVAMELFDTAVNLGRHRAVDILQEALNLLNRNGKYYADIVVDGTMGRKTLAALAENVARDPYTVELVNLMNHLQAEHYINRMRRSPVSEKYVGWFART